MMKRTLLMSFSLMASVLCVAQKEWDNVAVPAEAGEGKAWELQEQPSDDFNYTFAPVTEKTTFGEKWTNFFHNHWDGPGTTYWQYNHVEVDGEHLVLRASRNNATTKMDVPGVNAGCITSTNRVLYPVFIESKISVADITLASDVWLLSPDDTQEIDIIECYGGAANGNGYFAKFVHLSHHSFIRQPFKDYQPTDINSWYARQGITSWGEYCLADGQRKFLRVGVNWIGPKHFEYYVDGELVRVLYDKAFASKVNGIWKYTYPTMTNGELDKDGGYQRTVEHGTSSVYDFAKLQAASNTSTVSVIDPKDFQNGNGFTKELDIIINIESQDWHVKAKRIPTDSELSDDDRNRILVDWIRVYKPVDNITDVTPRQKNEVTVYPNPTTGNLFIKGSANKSKTVSIFNVMGQKISKQVIAGNQINVSNLQNGYYVLKTSEGETVSFLKR